MSLPKWNEERTDALADFVGEESPVSQATVAEAAEQFETSTRSISSKLRKMGYEVELASASAHKTFSDEQADELERIVLANSGKLTYGEIAAEMGNFTPKQIQGKILSMELTEHVKPTPKAEAVKTYTASEEAQFLKLANSGAFLEEIAAALGKEINSVRGKALSFLRSGELTAIPKQRELKGTDKVDALEALGDISGYTVEKLADALGKTPRGVKTLLTRRGITIADYDGAARKAKAAEKAA
jgi:DNA-binding transcriptional ArsR family regulator